MHRTIVSLVLALVPSAAMGCVSIGRANLPLLEPQWTREELRASGSACGSKDCRVTLKTPRGPVVVTVRTRTYGLHEIPGWNSGSTTGRVVSGILGGLLRRQGLTTDRVEIGLGTRTVADSGDSPWQLRCSVFWIDDQEEEYNKDDMDHITRSVRRAEGADCRVVEVADTAVVRWRFRAGIAPGRDSLAAIYDSLAFANPRMVSATPPLSLERVTPDGVVEARYGVSRDSLLTFPQRISGAGRVTIRRESGDAVAVIHTGFTAGLDLAPGATPGETRVVRLVAALLAVSF